VKPSALLATGDELIPALRGIQRSSFVAGGTIAIICLLGFVLRPAQFFRSYLAAYLLLLGVTLGSLALAMVHQVSGGAWGVVIRRILGAATRTLPVLTILFVPIALGAGMLYPWTDASLVAHDEALQWKHPYLNMPFFLVRAVMYFAAWNALSYLLNRWSLEQDRSTDPTYARRMQLVSAGGLVVYGLTITFASFDWLMSLEPHWFSTIYGVLVIGGQGLAAMAFSIIILQWLSSRAPLNDIVTHAHFHDLGNLLLAFVMLWAYFSFSQYLIIWSGNLPEETEWYLHRVATSWKLVGGALVILHFALPFVLLLSRAMKRRAQTLAAIAGLVLLMRYVDLFWLTAPAFHPGGLQVHWLDVAVPLALGPIWFGAFVHELRGRPLLPVHDPEFQEAVGRAVGRLEQQS
jgi:hypothetical protein